MSAMNQTKMRPPSLVICTGGYIGNDSPQIKKLVPPMLPSDFSVASNQQKTPPTSPQPNTVATQQRPVIKPMLPNIYD